VPQVGKRVASTAGALARCSSSPSRIYAVIKTKKNVVAAAVMISSTMRGSRKGFMPP
jgi:uncharacterized protein (DUF2336 family)